MNSKCLCASLIIHEVQTNKLQWAVINTAVYRTETTLFCKVMKESLRFHSFVNTISDLFGMSHLIIIFYFLCLTSVLILHLTSSPTPWLYVVLVVCQKPSSSLTEKIFRIIDLITNSCLRRKDYILRLVWNIMNVGYCYSSLCVNFEI